MVLEKFVPLFGPAESGTMRQCLKQDFEPVKRVLAAIQRPKPCFDQAHQALL